MLSTIRRLFGAVLAVLTPETEFFAAHRRISQHHDLPWLRLPDQFSRNSPAPRPEAARPQIGGTRITWEWLTSINRRECLYRFRFFPEQI
ncbi:hypothetical protein R3P38DRAFT_3231663 [Favolaschia claudopus]|uniref:Uncharacterized protein n=1 Tax=Favolaschia claudopus TaxID=2862362 RepID=A0AAV9ZJQ3_9AGAR